MCNAKDINRSKPRKLPETKKNLLNSFAATHVSLACVAKMAQISISKIDLNVLLGKSKYRFILAALHEPIILGLVTAKGWRPFAAGDTPAKMFEEEMGHQWRPPEQ